MKLIKLHEYEGEFYVLTPSNFEEREWDIIGKGKTKEESLINSLEMMVERSKKFTKDIQESFKNFSSSILDDGKYLKECYQPKTISTKVTEEESEEPFSFSSFYIEEDETLVPMNEFFTIHLHKEGDEYE